MIRVLFITLETLDTEEFLFEQSNLQFKSCVSSGQISLKKL